MKAQMMQMVVNGFGVLTKKKHRQGTSSRTGNDYEIFSVEIAYLGGSLELSLEKDQYDQLHENTEYEVSGGLVQDGFNQKLVNPRFVEVAE
jgi:hypothetical protein